MNFCDGFDFRFLLSFDDLNNGWFLRSKVANLSPRTLAPHIKANEER